MDTSHPSRSKRKPPDPGEGKRPLPGDGPRRRGKAETPAREAHLLSLSARDDAKPFGKFLDGEFLPNSRGDAIAACWRELGALRPGLQPDALAIGPRRVEGILLLPAGEAALSEAVRLFKVVSSLRLSRTGKGTSALWKKGYAERHASDAGELAAMRRELKNPGIKAPAGGRTSPGKG